MELYIAVNVYSGEVKMFTCIEDLIPFAEDVGYSCNYYIMGNLYEMTLHEAKGGNEG